MKRNGIKECVEKTINRSLKWAAVFSYHHLLIYSLLILGSGYRTINVTLNGRVLATFDRKEKKDSAIKAFALQIALIWVLNIDYQNSVDGKPLNEIYDFFQFVMIFLWNIRTKETSSGTGQQGRSQTATKKGCAHWKEIFPQKK